MHRFVWDLREAPPQSVVQDLPIAAVARDTPRFPQGPLVMPGRYVVELDVNGTTARRSVTVRMDPRSISLQALRRQYDLARVLTAIMDRSYRDAIVARERHRAGDAGKFDALNADAAFLLDTIDGVDAAPTRQSTAAVFTLEARLRETARLLGMTYGLLHRKGAFRS